MKCVNTLIALWLVIINLAGYITITLKMSSRLMPAFGNNKGVKKSGISVTMFNYLNKEQLFKMAANKLGITNAMDFFGRKRSKK
jgi:hypothetical protein